MVNIACLRCFLLNECKLLFYWLRIGHSFNQHNSFSALWQKLLSQHHVDVLFGANNRKDEPLRKLSRVQVNPACVCVCVRHSTEVVSIVGSTLAKLLGFIDALNEVP